MNAEGDHLFMELALELALEGVGDTSPNPAVGCVIVKDGAVIGHGYHRAAGLPHAEIEALEDAGDEAVGADVYVTLEPCSHHGKTPPCVDALIAAGVKRVVVANEDPNPQVAGSGIATLRAASIEVKVGLLAEKARKLNEPFNLSIVEKRSFLHLKLGATLDGRIATTSGDSKWITSEESREIVHHLRDRCKAVMVGVGTINSDDPKLTVRLPGEDEVEILRCVIDKNLDIHPGSWMLSKGHAQNTMIFCGPAAPDECEEELSSLGAKVIRVGDGPTGLDLREVLEEIYRTGRMEVLLEGGSRTAKSFVDAGLVDRCHFFYAPKLLGGAGVSMFTGKGPEKIEQALLLEEMEVLMVGPDIYVTGTLGRG